MAKSKERSSQVTPPTAMVRSVGEREPSSGGKPNMRRFKNIIRSPKQKSLLSGVNAPKNFVVEPFSVKNQCIDVEALHSRSVEETKTVTLNLHESQAAGRQSGMEEDELLSKSTLNKVE